MKHRRGFTLVEMVVVLVIMAILLGLGLTSYRNFIANQKLRSTAEVFMSGMQMARAEAVKLNQKVEFILTDTVPIPANVDTATTSTTGRSWMVRALPVAPATTHTFIEGKSGAEGSGAASSTASAIAVTGSLASVTFDGYGAPVGLAANQTFQFSDSLAATDTVHKCVADGGEIRCLTVRLGRDGQTRLCDPAVPATDTRTCGP
jgi:type IV fimbrial biogenesis protein FimT